MPGSGASKRQHAEAILGAQLAANGWTHHEIAELLGKRDDQIRALVLLGERLQFVDERDKERHDA
ncbi:MAG: hypothetical protein ACYDBH_20350 [Acidobacteriaceae bacterium]